MSLLTKKRPAADDVRRVALAALTAALDDGGGEAKPKRFKGVRTLAVGAAIYTAGVAAFKNRDAILERLQEDDADEEDFDDEEYEDEPVAEEDEDFDDEEYEGEPYAEEDLEDEDYEEEDYEEEDYEEDDEEAEDSAGSRPPVRSDRGSPDEQDPEIPEPPSRPRAPVGRR